MSLPRLVNGLFLNYKDINGGQANGLWTIQDQSDGGSGPYGSIVDSTQNLTVCGVFAGVIQKRFALSGTPTTGVYGTVSDQVVFRVQSANYATNVAIPGPVDSIFLADTFTVDLTNTLVTSWFSSFAATFGDSLGSPWTALLWGRRRMINLSTS
jgi:hypothetical protein